MTSREELIKQQRKAQESTNWLVKLIIETNNKETIKEAIEYIYQNSIAMWYPCQFLYSALYTLGNSKEIEVSDDVYDLAQFDLAIEVSNDLELELRKL